MTSASSLLQQQPSNQRHPGCSDSKKVQALTRCSLMNSLVRMLQQDTCNIAQQVHSEEAAKQYSQ
jgi:hypothetical protein